MTTYKLGYQLYRNEINFYSPFQKTLSQNSVSHCLLTTPSRICQFQVYPRKLFFWLWGTWCGCQSLGTAYEFSTCPGACQGAPGEYVRPPQSAQESGNLDTSSSCLTPSSSWGMGPGGRRPSHPWGWSQMTPHPGYLPPHLVSLPRSCEGHSWCNEAARLVLRCEGTAEHGRKNLC